MNCLAVIPARGGSKGIPRKNIRPLAGKPLIAYNIEQALRSHFVSRLVVSTDDTEIAAVAQQYGSEIVWRPAEISGDTASSESALLHTLEYLHLRDGYQPDLLVFLQCTSPLTLAEDIDGTIDALLEQNADTALAVIPFHYFLWRLNQNAEMGANADADAVGINHDKRFRPLRQQREPQYLETGAVYVMRVPGFLEARHRFFGKTALYIMPPERRLEIDDPVDFEIAEVMVKQLDTGLPLITRLPDPVRALVLDFDGVFTDNKVIVFQDGREAVTASRSDGWGIAQLKKAGLKILVLSSEANPVVQARADKLGIDCIHGVQDKLLALQNWLHERQIEPSGVIYLGNDENDIACMSYAGCAAAVADAHPSVLPYARLTLKHAGGQGAIRELSEIILHQR
jgi:YrbI family 3-deoxy-D-manno-octulosonate 8-phosphate phosphatase